MLRFKNKNEFILPSCDNKRKIKSIRRYRLSVFLHFRKGLLKRNIMIKYDIFHDEISSNIFGISNKLSGRVDFQSY